MSKIIVTELATGRTWDFSEHGQPRAIELIQLLDNSAACQKAEYHLHVDGWRAPSYRVRSWRVGDPDLAPIVFG